MKRNLTNEKARERNKATRSALRTAIRRFREAADSGDTEAAQARLREASRKLDKAASKGVIHKNAAANKKSALAKRATSS
jgi:small subunit ribosomal protein S20